MDKNSGKKQSSRIVVIGLDSADFYLVQRWINEGHLPTLATLIERGSWGRLQSTADVGSNTVWPTFFTGASPAKNYGFCIRRIKSGTYRVIDEPYANMIKREPFWLQLSRAGKRVAILDVPVTYPIEGLNGKHLVAWGVHGPCWHQDSWPSELIKEVISRFGSYPHRCPEIVSSYNEVNQMIEFYGELISGVKKKGSVSKYFLDQDVWDLFITVFAESHCAGHNLWHLMDENHPAYDSEMGKTLGDSIFNVYSLIDSEIARLIDAAGDATFFIFSPEGMGSNYTGSHLLPEILRRLGLAVQPHESASGSTLSKRVKVSANRLLKLTPASRWGPSAVRNIRSLLPKLLINAIEIVKLLVPKQLWYRWKAYLLTAGNNWRWSRAFCLPSDFNGAIRINLKGREPLGLVEPGAEYELLCNELIQELSNLINVDTEKKAVNEVLRVNQIHKGEYIDELPDIIVKWAGDAPINGLYSPRIGTVTGENRHDRVGAHTSYGFLIAFGKHIAEGRTFEGANIMDIAPTILYLMEQQVPRDMDGKVLLDIVDEDFKANNPVRYT